MDREISPHMWRRDAVVEVKKSRMWYEPYKSVCTTFQYMYACCSGNNRVSTQVVVGIVAYVCGFQ
jgi:hypothetical protein